MRKAIVLTALLALSLTVMAQGNVSVKQSAEINNLVFGKKQPAAKTKEQLKAEKKAKKEAEKAAKKAEKEAKKAKKEAEKKAKKEAEKAAKNPAPVVQKPVEPVKPAEPVIQKPVEPKPAPKVEEPSSDRPRTITKVVRRRVKRADGTYATRKVTHTKMYKGMKKTRGFRVQIFSGGNTREDRLQAERAGAKIKTAFPDMPVYVHFYSPRWMCLVGNFTRKEDANTFMRKAKNEGFGNANVIQTMVTVRNAIK